MTFPILKYHYRFSFVLIAVVAISHASRSQSNKPIISDSGYFELRGFNVLVFSNRYGLFGDEKASGIEIIHHGVRTATNGDIRLDPTPMQWDSIPQFVSRNVNRDAGHIEGKLRYTPYDFDYTIRVQPREQGVSITIHFNKPLPKELENKAGFNLEFLPAAYFRKSYLADNKSGIFPLYPSSSIINNERLDPKPLATGKMLVLAPEDPERRITIRSDEHLSLYDGRNQAQNGWFVVRGLIPAGKTGTVLEWQIIANTIPNWTRQPMIAYSQVGYHPDQKKIAIIELDRNDRNISTARLLRVSENGNYAEKLKLPVKRWGDYLRYRYYSFDFSSVKENGVYILEYGQTRSKAFRIANDVYATAWHPTLDVFFPVQMDHMFVNEAYRVWHGRSHMDDALQAPVNHTHFDLYRQGASTGNKFQPGEHIPGLNVGGWYDAGDFDLRTQTIYATVMSLVQTWEAFKPLRDETFIDQDTKYADIHHPDGKPDILQQIEHGTLQLLAQQKAVGYAINGIVEAHLDQYTHLGDAVTKTDNLIYNAKLKEHESDGFSSGKFDDRWAFTNRSTPLNYGAAAALAAASRALKSKISTSANVGYNDTLAEECLNTAKKIWEDENGHAPDLFRHGNTTGGNLLDEKLRAALELLLATGDKKFADTILARVNDFERQIGRFAVVALNALPYMNTEQRAKIEAGVKTHKINLDRIAQQNPFAVPIGTGGWAGSGQVIGFANNNYLLHKAFPKIISEEDVFRGLHFILGCHPGSNLSLVSAVGTQSKEVAYGNNRADYSFIAGGIVPGVLILSPDFPENKEDWPFIWGENEYVINLGASYIFLVHAVNDLLKENQY